MIKYTLTLLILLVSTIKNQPIKPTINPSKIDSLKVVDEKKWVDSIYNTFSFEEKVGQLFMVATYSNKDEVHYQAVDKLIKDYHIGGLIFFQGGPKRQAKLTNRFQKNAKTPLFIGIDAEWGLSMRLDSTYRYPWNMTLGAIKDDALIEKMGTQVAEQSKRLGIHFTFAPVVDINTNPNNPIIGNRSFGESKENVAQKAVAYMNGLQKNGVFATAKHFPGHGDSSTDSHHALPIINFTKQRIFEEELFPYKKLIENNLSSIMVAHLNVPSLEKQQNIPSSISYEIVTNILKKELNFEGLIFTDALNMKGASNFKQPGDIDFAAFMAGNDILLFSENVPKAVEKFKEAYQNGKLTDDRLEYSVKKILKYKFRANLDEYKPIEMNGIYEDLNKSDYDALNHQLYENAITTLQNEDKIIPITNFQNEKIAYVPIGDNTSNVFFEYLNKYTKVDKIENTSLITTLSSLKNYSKVIIGYHRTDNIWKKNNPSNEQIQWINAISNQKKTIVTFFTRPYSLPTGLKYESIEGLIMAYQDNTFTHQIVPQIIFGATGSKGKLPVSIHENFTTNEGINTDQIKRLGFDYPQNQGFDENKLAKIDTIIQYAIAKKMTPGAQIIVARSGKVIYNKSFGKHTYDSNIDVKNDDLYDIASLTKIVATLPSIMQVYEKKGITFSTTLSEMLPVFKGTNKESATLLDMLTHQARFQPWIPFYKNTLDSLKKPNKAYYKTFESKEFPYHVANNMFLRKDFNDTIINTIAKSDLLLSKQYKYSDFSFILLKEYLEMYHNQKLDSYVQENFYAKIGMNTTTYNPLNKFDKQNIIPTEVDNYYRYQTIHGNVHDMAAAMQGGVSGHAGLFSNALDVAKMMQLFLQNGTYGNQTFFDEKTMNSFNVCYFCDENNRRGVGFDKPQLGKEGPTCGCVSMQSFGHTGFTGTMAWADPEKEIVYVFLSNRTYPDSNASNKLSKENIRENIQRVIYDSLLN